MALNEAGNPYRCPCCWDCGDCMPLSIDIGGVYPSMEGDWETCLTNNLATWVEPTETDRCTASRIANGDRCFYATVSQSITECSNASWQAIQYCVEDADGTNGRAWIVEVWFNIVAGASPGVYHFVSRVLDWRCTCSGARFEWTISGTLPDCTPAGGGWTPECPCGETCLEVTLPAIREGHNPGDTLYCQSSARTVQLTKDPVDCVWLYTGSDGVADDVRIVPGGIGWILSFSGGPCDNDAGNTAMGYEYECATCVGTYTLLSQGCGLPVCTTDRPSTLSVTAC